MDQLPFQTPSPPTSSHNELPSSPWISGTPQDLRELAKQQTLLEQSIKRSSQSPTQPLAKVIKCCQLFMTRQAIQDQEIQELRESIVQLQKKKERKRTHLQHGGVIQVGEVQQLIISHEKATQQQADMKKKREEEAQKREQEIQNSQTSSSSSARFRCTKCFNYGHRYRQCTSN